MNTVSVNHAEKGNVFWCWAERMLLTNHYLHTVPDPRTSYEVYTIGLRMDVGTGPYYATAGVMVFGRPEATRCQDWYGGVDDVRDGRCEVTRWQVLNLARVWIDPVFQAGGEGCKPGYLPGFVDRKGIFHSTLASEAIAAAVRVIGKDYLLRRPPVFLDEPFELRWLLSYCDPRYHKGTIYQASGFELYRVNAMGMQTWRKRLPGLNEAERREVVAASRVDRRAQQYRAKRNQLALEF